MTARHRCYWCETEFTEGRMDQISTTRWQCRNEHACFNRLIQIIDRLRGAR